MKRVLISHEFMESLELHESKTFKSTAQFEANHVCGEIDHAQEQGYTELPW